MRMSRPARAAKWLCLSRGRIRGGARNAKKLRESEQIAESRLEEAEAETEERERELDKSREKVEQQEDEVLALQRQLKTSRARMVHIVACALGIAIGCILGMCPLLFLDQEAKRLKEGFDDVDTNGDGVADSVMMDTTGDGQLNEAVPMGLALE